MNFKEAVVHVLQRDGSLHYTEIAERILESRLLESNGATPHKSVSAVLTTSINSGESLFERVRPGYYRLFTGVKTTSSTEVVIDDEQAQVESTGLIKAFGMFWKRDCVTWKSNPQLFGVFADGSKPIDFSRQRGVYLLYDAREVIYVGRVRQGKSLGSRLYDHTTNRLKRRWDRVSWFGVLADSELDVPTKSDDNFDIDMLITTMEALLIESLEPVQNRKRGDEFRAIEYFQHVVVHN